MMIVASNEVPRRQDSTKQYKTVRDVYANEQSQLVATEVIHRIIHVRHSDLEYTSYERDIPTK